MRATPIPVRPGELWTLLDFRSGRFAVRVVRIEGRTAHCERVRDGKAMPIALRTLERGMRGARPLEAPGPAPTGRAVLRNTVQENRTASECVRVVAPRGVVRASERDAQVAALRAQDWSRARIAAHLGLTVGQVESALRRAREAREDEANRRAAG